MVRVGSPQGLAERVERLRASGVRFVRLQYADLHGVARGKVVPLDELEWCVEEGVAFAAAIMTTDLRHNVVSGLETGIPDMRARPDVGTLVQVPWQPEAAWCLCDLEDARDGMPFAVDPRGTLRRAVEACAQLGFVPVVGPELEFYLCEPDPAAPGRYRRYVDHCSSVYTVGAQSDPRGILQRLLESAAAMGLGAFAANHEYGRGQFEINLRHSPALDSADRAFRYKALVKELAAREGLLATFMGRPWNDDEGSGLHLHISLAYPDGSNAFWDAGRAGGLTDVALHFIAGILARVPALMAFLNPTVNAYRRINIQGLVPRRANWGYDHRLALIRVPPDRGSATRLELRVGDGTANPYLAYAAVIHAGLDGIRRGLWPPEPVEGLLDDLPEERRGTPLPGSLDAALSALEADDLLPGALGPELVRSYLALKWSEFRRFQQWTTDWELAEYAHHL